MFASIRMFGGVEKKPQELVRSYDYLVYKKLWILWKLLLT